MEPTRLYPIIALLSLITVEFGGWALLGFLTSSRREKLGEFREQFFRAGHAHAGVLLILSLVYFLYLPRAGYSEGVEWLLGGLLLAGSVAQSSGFFLHMGLGGPERNSAGATLTRVGALLLGVALVMLAVGMIRHA